MKLLITLSISLVHLSCAKGFTHIVTYTLLHSIFTAGQISEYDILTLQLRKLQCKRVKSLAISSDGWDQDLNGCSPTAESALFLLSI